MPRRAASLLFVLVGCFESEASHEHVAERASVDAPAETWIPNEHECEGCHDAAAASWASSRHHLAFTNVDFQRAYARETEPFCRDCHAPGFVHAEPLPRERAEARGVGCVDCHVEGARLLSSGDPSTPSAAPHALEREPEFGTRSCARCHEFDFTPTSPRRGTMMQTTMREHRASPHAARSCASCHMPAASHAFASSRDDAALRRALQVEAWREGDELVVSLTPHEVGHALPTGDLFRRLALQARWLDAEGHALATATRYLDRNFVPLRHADGRPNLALRLEPNDDRVHGPTTIRLGPRSELEQPGASLELEWSLDYQRVDDRNHREPGMSTIASEVRIAGGRLGRCSP